MDALHTAYRKLLEPWIKSAVSHVFTPPDRPDLKYYGTGTNVWGIQTHQKAFSAFAVLAADPDTDPNATGLSQDAMRDTALAMLRFTLHSHHVGNYHCMDNETEKWGHHWLSPLGIERMMHGVETIWEFIPDADRVLFRKMMISECDWVLNNRTVCGDPVSPNVPESNLWNGAFLHRTVMMYPDVPDADAYKTHGTHLLLNSISVPSDAESTRVFDGKPMKEWFAGANFFEDYALNHHGYMNVGYMVICLSNIAMLHFPYRKMGQTPPAALYQHMEHLWRLVKACTFDDGRLFRIGGDTRVRYCYCQDYLVPTLVMIADCLGESVDEKERGWIHQVSKEMAYNADDSFLSKRCELFAERSPLYYTRLESDRACTLSMAAYWRREYDEIKKPYGTGDYALDPDFRAPLTLWHNDYLGACYSRGEQRLASFVWGAAEPPIALLTSPLDSSMVEWKNNMTSFFEGNGLVNKCQTLGHSEKLFDGGFVTAGRYEAVTSGLLEENDTENTNLINHIAYAALPDGRTVINIQHAKAIRRCHLIKVNSLNLNIPNDVFNDFQRAYTSGDTWLNVDGKLSVISAYGGTPTVHHSSVRQIGIKSIGLPKYHLSDSLAYAGRGTLRCDEILMTDQNKPQWFEKDATIFDFAVVLVTHLDGEQTTQEAKTVVVPKLCGGKDGRAVRVMGQDGCEYLVVANFSDQETTYTACHVTVTLNAYAAEVIKLPVER